MTLKCLSSNQVKPLNLRKSADKVKLLETQFFKALHQAFEFSSLQYMRMPFSMTKVVDFHYHLKFNRLLHPNEYPQRIFYFLLI